MRVTWCELALYFIQAVEPKQFCQCTSPQCKLW